MTFVRDCPGVDSVIIKSEGETGLYSGEEYYGSHILLNIWSQCAEFKPIVQALIYLSCLQTSFHSFDFSSFLTELCMGDVLPLRSGVIHHLPVACPKQAT